MAFLRSAPDSGLPAPDTDALDSNRQADLLHRIETIRRRYKISKEI
jgi:hypothetical protein